MEPPQLLLLLLLLGSSGSNGIQWLELGNQRPREIPAPGRIPPRLKRAEDPGSFLQWIPFRGQLPPQAVSNWNQYSQRLEWVCGTGELGCNTGAYSPQRGPACFFPYAGWERSTSNFQLLVNLGGLESLSWVDDSFGEVPEGAVEGCPGSGIYVGRNPYGLGKISKEQRAFFHAEDGVELWSKWYQVLVASGGGGSVTISQLSYNWSSGWESGEEITLTGGILRNWECWKSWKSLELEATTEEEQSWDLEGEIFSRLRGVLLAPPLIRNGSSWGLSPLTSVPWVGGGRLGKLVRHREAVGRELEGARECRVVMEGRVWEFRVPFGARISRELPGGGRHGVDVAGWARRREVLGVRVGIKECWALPGLQPCRG